MPKYVTDEQKRVFWDYITQHGWNVKAAAAHAGVSYTWAREHVRQYTRERRARDQALGLGVSDHAP
jgi:transposase